MRRWYTVEQDGILFVWYHAAASAPSWLLPPMPSGSRRHAEPVELRWQVPTHVQEIRENIGDETHFSVIHRLPPAGAVEFDARGPFAKLGFPSDLRLLLTRVVAILSKREVDKEVEIWSHKRWLERPVFVGPERTQRKIRSWYRQFYETKTERAGASPT